MNVSKWRRNLAFNNCLLFDILLLFGWIEAHLRYSLLFSRLTYITILCITTIHSYKFWCSIGHHSPDTHTHASPAVVDQSSDLHSSNCCQTTTGNAIPTSCYTIHSLFGCVYHHLLSSELFHLIRIVHCVVSSHSIRCYNYIFNVVSSILQLHKIVYGNVYI